eukprot:jgi/Picsp_1/4351/NSC_01857-R1_histone-lysine n-methyltransferase mll
MDNRREYSSGQDGAQHQAGMKPGRMEDIDKSNSEKIGRWIMNLGTNVPLNPGNERYPASGGKGWDQRHYDVSKLGTHGLHMDGRPETQSMYGSGELNRLPHFQQDARGVGSPGFQDPNIRAGPSNWDRSFPHDPLRMGYTTSKLVNQRDAPGFPGFAPDFASYMRGGPSPYGTPPPISPGALYNQSLPVPAFNAWRPTDPMRGSLPPRQQSAPQPRNDLLPTSSFHGGSYASKRDYRSETSFLAKILPNLITVAENIATVDPYITVDQFKELLERLFGSFAGTEQISFSSLLEFYRVVRKTQNIPDNVVVVLKTLSQAFMNFAENPVDMARGSADQPRYRSADLRAEIMQQLPRNGIGMSPSVLGGEGAEARKLREEMEQTIIHIPGGKALPITCNGNDGIFRMEDHSCDCYCDVCKLIKTYAGLKELRMSPREFERHCGMGHAKKWKASLRIKEKDKKVYKTLGYALDRLKIFNSIDGGKDDDLMIKYGRPKMKGAKASVANIDIADLEKVANRLKNKAEKQELSPATEPEIVKQTGDDAGREKASPINGVVDAEEEKKSSSSKVCNDNEAEEKKKEFVQQELKQASTGGATPEIAAWSITENNYLTLDINFGNFIFSGILTNLSRSDGETSNGQAKQDEVVHDKITAEQREVGNAVPQPNPSSVGKAKKDKKPTSQPITKKSEEYNKLLTSGPPEGTLCVLCGKPEEKGSGPNSLGELMLVKLTNVNNAWVHGQCAKWSPDVYDPKGDGNLEGVKDAIRRGRMIRCKHCNERGATLGCLVETCRSSYHLACARECNCILKLGPYEVYCPKHLKFAEKCSAKKKSRPKSPADTEIKKKRKSLSPLSKLGDVAASHLTETR